jgi:O-succinylbenzoate synthase
LIGRAANLVLTALLLFTLPGDTSASPHYFNKEITTPVLMYVGYLTVPTEDGINVTPELDFSNKITKSKVTMDYTKEH